MKSFEKLIEKYDVPAPRYTSYPPVPFWRNDTSLENWASDLRTSYRPDRGVDLYVHVPFCESLCYYCGCHRVVTKDHAREEEFVQLILREWEIYKKTLGFTPVVSALHFGGGTPTFLSGNNLKRLMDNLLQRKHPQFIGSIEVDPRTCRDDHIQVLRQFGFRRVSLGIQDFDEEVQVAIHRKQSFKMVESLVLTLRESGFESINFDLIYGLPRQTVDTLRNTIDLVARLAPDLISFYSYAHLPAKIKNQKLISEKDLLSGKAKRELFDEGRRLLKEVGFQDIGMDHFARETNYLFEAKRSGSLHRNFMGYTDKKSNVLIGLGPSAISDSGLSFAQNAKELQDYTTSLSHGHFPIEKTHTLSPDDQIIQKMILDIMCLEQFLLVDLLDVPYRDEIMLELKEMANDDLIVIYPDRVALTNLGKIFRRNVAMLFDVHLRQQTRETRFSQSL